MRDCINLMADALGTLARGDALLPLRTVIRLPGGNSAFAAMPAVLGNSIGAKIITVFPDNANTPFESHIGVVLYFDNEYGQLKAIIDASSVTAIRTAAVSGLATRLLANPNASSLAILGAGIQGRTHIEAVTCVRPISDIRVWSRSAASAERLASESAAHFGVRSRAVATAQEAVRDAHVICATSSSREPIVRSDWIAPGAHINAVGASVRTARELDTATVVRARLFVDRRESTLAESGDFLIPRDEGAIDNSHIVAELGDVVLGRAEGRLASSDLTIFKSLGLAIEDVACARFIHGKALEQAQGTWVHIGGLR